MALGYYQQITLLLTHKSGNQKFTDLEHAPAVSQTLATPLFAMAQALCCFAHRSQCCLSLVPRPNLLRVLWNRRKIGSGDFHWETRDGWWKAISNWRASNESGLIPSNCCNTKYGTCYDTHYNMILPVWYRPNNEHVKKSLLMLLARHFQIWCQPYTGMIVCA